MMKVDHALAPVLRDDYSRSARLHANRLRETALPAARHGAHFPEAPLISSQPLRYNVQLNHQLTRVQQADRFLHATENQLLKLDKASDRQGEKVRMLEQTQALLAQRQQLSGGSVNRQLQIALEGKSQVSFQLRDGKALLNNAQAEVIVFSLAGERRELSAASIAAGSSPQQTLIGLNQALGKWGIHGKITAQRDLIFEVDEAQWPRVAHHLSVQGSGARYPQGQFFPLKPQAEPTLEEAITHALADPEQRGALQPHIRSALAQIAQQRQQLLHVRGQVQQRVDSMANLSENQAQETAASVAQRLCAPDYHDIAKALGAQANLAVTTVRNVLSSQ